MNTQPQSISMHGHGNVIGDNNTVTVTINGREEAAPFRERAAEAAPARGARRAAG